MGDCVLVLFIGNCVEEKCGRMECFWIKEVTDQIYFSSLMGSPKGVCFLFICGVVFLIYLYCCKHYRFVRFSFISLYKSLNKISGPDKRYGLFSPWSSQPIHTVGGKTQEATKENSEMHNEKGELFETPGLTGLASPLKTS